MEWLLDYLPYIIFGGVMLLMIRRGGCCGGHGGHTDKRDSQDSEKNGTGKTCH